MSYYSRQKRVEPSIISSRINNLSQKYDNFFKYSIDIKTDNALTKCNLYGVSKKKPTYKKPTYKKPTYKKPTYKKPTL